MKSKSIICLGLVGVLSLGGMTTTFAKTNKVTSPTKKVAAKKVIQQAIKVGTKNIQSKDEYIEVDLKIPVIQGMKDKNLQDKINKQFEGELVKFKDDLVKQAKEASESLKKDGIEFKPYSVSSGYNVSYNKDNILSMKVWTYEYTGGAHGMPGSVCYNFDIKTGKNITLKDVFKKGIDYKKIINNEIKDQIKKNKTEIYDFKTISDTQNFLFGKGTLNIEFSAYEIASYAAGEPLFKIPVSKLKNYINLQFMVK